MVSDLRGQFENIDEGNFQEAGHLRQVPKAVHLRQAPEAEHLRQAPEDNRVFEEAPMPHLPPPPEMIEMQKNSLFPVDVPKLGANLPYRPPELIFDEFHKQVNNITFRECLSIDGNMRMNEYNINI
jgi:hypothetical protein